MSESKGKKVPVRRGTGPKARVQAFLRAYDAWRVLHDAKDRDDMSYDELCTVQRAEQDMHNARQDITGLLGVL